jgi:hypothetical protein
LGWFGSTQSKRRINFLAQLHAGAVSTEVNESALDYMQAQGLSAAIREQLAQAPSICRTLQSWQQHLARLEISDARHARMATEGALLGSLLEKGFSQRGHAQCAGASVP